MARFGRAPIIRGPAAPLMGLDGFGSEFESTELGVDLGAIGDIVKGIREHRQRGEELDFLEKQGVPRGVAESFSDEQRQSLRQQLDPVFQQVLQQKGVEQRGQQAQTITQALSSATVPRQRQEQEIVGQGQGAFRPETPVQEQLIPKDVIGRLGAIMRAGGADQLGIDPQSLARFIGTGRPEAGGKAVDPTVNPIPAVIATKFGLPPETTVQEFKALGFDAQVEEKSKTAPLKKVLDPTSPTGWSYKSLTGEVLPGAEPPAKGSRLKVNDDGSIEFTQGDVGLTPAVTTDFQKRIDSTVSTLGVMDQLREILTPQNVGLIGDVSTTVQGITEQGGAIGEMFTSFRNDVETNSRREDLSDFSKLNSRGINLLDPNLNAVQFLEGLLTFRIAKTFDPTGRLAKDDVERAEKAIGTNKAFIGIEGFTQRLDAFEKFAERDLKRIRSKSGDTREKRFNKLIDQGFTKEQAFQQLIEERY